MDYIAASNCDEVLEHTLLASPSFSVGGNMVVVAKGHTYIGTAYNFGIDQTSNPIMCFVHQDVYLPEGWEERVTACIDSIEQRDPAWAVIGVVGIDENWQVVGRCWSNGLQREILGKTSGTAAAVSVDELVIILKRASGLKFDENLPGFHFYGTDIVQQALSKSLSAYVINAPVIHNSIPVLKWDENIFQTYKYMRAKWKHQLPLKTTITTITKSPQTICKQRIKAWLSKGDRNRFARHPDPARKALDLGY